MRMKKANRCGTNKHKYMGGNKQKTSHLTLPVPNSFGSPLIEVQNYFIS